MKYNTNHVAGVCVPGSVTLSHSCEDDSEGGPLLVGLSMSRDGEEEGELTSRFVISITICGQMRTELDEVRIYACTLNTGSGTVFWYMTMSSTGDG